MDKRRAKQYPTGTRPHGNGIEIKFIWPKASKSYVHKTLDWSPSPANLSKAGKLRQEITDAIKHDTFRWGDYFPDDPRATELQTGSFMDYAQTWLDSPENDWTPQTRYKFKGILNRVWMPALDVTPIKHIDYSALTKALKIAVEAHIEKNKRDPSVSLYNDWLTCLRGVFETAIKDQAISRATNPATEFKNKTRIKTEPDPLDTDEMNAIIADIYKHDGNMWGAWFELGFYTGMRYPSEPSALTWQHMDFSRNELQVKQIRSRHAKGGIQKKTKTGIQRTILLNSRAQHAIKIARELTGFNDEWIFLQDVKNATPVITGDPQRNMWRASLKRLGIRHRDMYNMRHSYATFGLMNNANPGFMASQLGHSLEEFFKTYAKWINRMNNSQQLDFIEKGIQSKSGKILDQSTKKTV